MLYNESLTVLYTISFIGTVNFLIELLTLLFVLTCEMECDLLMLPADC